MSDPGQLTGTQLRDAPRTADQGHRVVVELIRLSVRDGAVTWRACSADLPVGEIPEVAARRLAGPDSLRAAGLVLHSTSWRYDDGHVLTYATFPDEHEATGVLLGHHVVVGRSATEPAPGHVSVAHVAAHAARHLADLATGRDPHVSACALADPTAWRLLLDSSRAVHVQHDHTHRPTGDRPRPPATRAGRNDRAPRPAPSVVAYNADEPALPGLGPLAQRCAEADGHPPFDEHTLLAMDGASQLPHARIELRQGGELFGCAVLSEGREGWTVEGAVDPARRGDGWGRDLLEAARDHVASHGGGLLRAWVHGTHGPADAVAESWGAVVERHLHVMRRPLAARSPSAARRSVVPPGLRERSLDPSSGVDRDAWLVLTNEAFQGHPDNGGWSRSELDWRFEASWTAAGRFPVVEDAQGIVAGVWTKRVPGEEEGELYVVAVAERVRGRGLGRLVVDRALDGLRADGCARAVLYVDADNTPAVGLYRSVGFVPGVDHRCLRVDVSGRRPTGST